MTYAVMVNPVHRRMYKNAATRMAINEFSGVFAGGEGLHCAGTAWSLATQAARPCNRTNRRKERGDDSQARSVNPPHPLTPREVVIGGVPYILFDRETPLTPEELRILSRLSFVYTLFECNNGNGTNSISLTPLEKSPAYLLDESLSSMLKYTGKTNELFTRLMLLLATADSQTPLNILDPLAGKGTTLFEALIHNHNACGIEIDPKTPVEADQYLKKFLELACIKHSTHKEKTSGTAPNATASGGEKFTATRHQIELARDKEAMRSGNTRQFEIINGDTRHTTHFYKKDFFHAIVADLPYGVQHASKDKKKPSGSGFTRNAMGLLKEALPGWLRVLKPGGKIVLAWNLFLIPRAEMEDLFTQHSLTVQPLPDFTHRVDQAIERDVIVGIK